MRAQSRIRVLAPIALTLATAEAGARLLIPSEHAEPVSAVDADAYFSGAEQRRGTRYARGQFCVGLASSAAELAVIMALVRRARRPDPSEPPEPPAPPAPPAPADWPEVSRSGTGATPRAVLAGAGVAAGLALATTVTTLPFSVISRQRSVKVGLVTQSWRGWADDLLKATAIGTGFAALLGAGVTALTRRYPLGWWAPAAGGSVVLGAGVAALAPVLLDPVFNDFVPLAAGTARSDVLELAGAAGVKVGEVFSVDASRRTTAANAYVTGLGPTKRVVLFDTLLSSYTRDEVRVVVAHELAHVRFRDVPRGVAFATLLAGPAALAIQRLSWVLAPGADGTAAALPALALAAGLISAPLGMIANRISRAIERRADQFSLSLSGAAGAFVSFERKIALQNVADLRPPRWLSRLGTHPPTLERIAMAIAYKPAP